MSERHGIDPFQDAPPCKAEAGGCTWPNCGCQSLWAKACAEPQALPPAPAELTAMQQLNALMALSMHAETCCAIGVLNVREGLAVRRLLLNAQQRAGAEAGIRLPKAPDGGGK